MNGPSQRGPITAVDISSDGRKPSSPSPRDPYRSGTSPIAIAFTNGTHAAARRRAIRSSGNLAATTGPEGTATVFDLSA
jgi:hypothetical protein